MGRRGGLGTASTRDRLPRRSRFGELGEVNRTSLRDTTQYPLNEHVGHSARDSLKEAGGLCEYLEKLDLGPHNMGWVRPYLMAMGGALQLLDMVAFKSPETLRTTPVEARQRILMSMDLLSGCLAYATSTVEGTYN